MAQISLPHLCPLCNQPVEDGQPRRVCAIDLTRWPDDAPLNLWGHKACAAGRAELPILRRDPS